MIDAEAARGGPADGLHAVDGNRSAARRRLHADRVHAFPRHSGGRGPHGAATFVFASPTDSGGEPKFPAIRYGARGRNQLGDVVKRVVRAPAQSAGRRRLTFPGPQRPSHPGAADGSRFRPRDVARSCTTLNLANRVHSQGFKGFMTQRARVGSRMHPVIAASGAPPLLKRPGHGARPTQGPFPDTP